MKVKIIRVSGVTEEHEVKNGPAAFRAIGNLIGASLCDSVNLRDGRVMLVDDLGYETETVNHGNGHIELKTGRARKPVNPTATKLYHGVCRPGTTHQIVGDVAIFVDADLA